jgi:predicted amidohydrolase YtcJ
MSDAGGLLLRRAELAGRIVDVRTRGGRIDAIAPSLAATSDEMVIDARGGALLPGLHDHHIHLLASAAAARSLVLGPPSVRDADAMAAALQEADAALARGDWIRAVGYHESVAGDLDRHALDRIVAGRPVRVQHRSGARWILNTAAIDALDLGGRDHPAVERDAAGVPTGRVDRADDWLRSLLPAGAAPDLSSLGAALAAAGVTGVTDTTPSERVEDLTPLGAAVTSGSLPQRVVVTGGPALAAMAPPTGLVLGPVKVVVDDGAYPSIDELAGHIAAAHAHGRAVAIHCVTRPALVLALAACDAAGSQPGDRVEHGSVIPAELIGELRRQRLTVVTQPALVAERGDDYERDVDRDDLPHLYRIRSLLDAGVAVAASSDAPYTDPDPWAAVRAAVSRSTPSGRVLGPDERVSPAVALGLFLGAPLDPGGPARPVEVGAPADLCLLGPPLATVLERLRADDVVATICAGRVAHHAG